MDEYEADSGLGGKHSDSKLDQNKMLWSRVVHVACVPMAASEQDIPSE